MPTSGTGNNAAGSLLRFRRLFRRAFTLAAGLALCCLVSARPAVPAEPPMVTDNLFSPDRRMPERQEPQSEPEASQTQRREPPPLDNAIKVNGVFLYGSSRRALLDVSTSVMPMEQRDRESPAIWVSPGDAVGEYRVAAVDKEGVTLTHGEEIFTVPIVYKGAAPKPPAAPQARRPQPSPSAQQSKPTETTITIAGDSPTSEDPMAVLEEAAKQPVPTDEPDFSSLPPDVQKVLRGE